MVTIHSLHLLVIGIFFLVVSQVAPFQESLLSLMTIMGIILVILGIYFRIVRALGLKIKKVMGKTGNPKQIPVSKNYYLTYFLIAIAFFSTLGGLMTMPF